MKRALLPIVLCAVWAVACGPKHPSNPTRPRETGGAGGAGSSLVVLLPDADTGLTGRANVTNPFGSVDLVAKYDTTSATRNRRLAPVSTLSEADVKRIFGDALSALPPPLQHFTLFFRFESDELTDESRGLLPEVVKVVRERAAPDVAIVGHTDTAGSSSANVQLGLKRSTAVRTLLVAAGLDPSLIEVTSHGEADLLIQTADETAEPRNRRVEISVR